MSRKRNHSFAETSLSPELQNAFMETSGPTGRADDDFLELEPDEELLCSVSDITEHLGRNITVVLETALSEIRKMVSVRIRVLKMELRDKTDEIEVLKLRLETAQRDADREPFPGSLSAEASAAAFRKQDFQPAGKHGASDAKKAKPAMPGVKKENINAICDYLMKDKNSRGGGADMDGEHGSPPAAGGDRDADPHPLNLWPDGGMSGAGAGDGESDPAAVDIFSMLPSGSKRMYEYEWMTGMEYAPELKGKSDFRC